MNKTLKKTLSIILSILMIVTSIPFALAAGDGVPLTIDITDKSNVSIGNGKTYYDEDGYIITGTNKDLIVYVYEEGNFVFRNASFKSFMLNGGDYEVTITLEGDNYLGATEDYYCGISFSYQHLIIEGGENDTLNFNCKASAIDTGGNPGTCTVNGGKINAVTETDQNYSTLRSFGGFIMNGGEVTLSNNHYDVVGCPVTLNGGVLNVIGTSTDCAAVNQKITVEKGALLTVSSACGIFSDWYGTDIVVADDAEENTLLFAKYNTEDEFAPVYDIKSALDGKTYAEIKADTHNHSFTNDECACGFVCEHTDREDGFCTVCKRYIYEITHQPTLEAPYVKLNNDADALYQWYTATDKVAEVIDGNEIVDKKENTYYEEETGWNGTWYDGVYVEYFDIYLKAGQKLTLIPDAYCMELTIYSLVEFTTVESQECEAGTELTYIAENDGWYSIFAYADSDSSDKPRLRAYADAYDYTKIENETSARLEIVEIGKKYACKVTYGDGKTEMSDVFEYAYAITHQPTSGEPYVELNDDTDASYQWYEVERSGSEITDENADTVVYDWGESSYDKETGWTGVAYDENIPGQDFFTVALKAGETVTVELTGDFTEGVGLWNYNINDGIWIDAEEGVSSYEITVGADGDYTFYTGVNSGVVTVKAYSGATNYTAIEGEASAEIKNPESGKRYACEVTFADGKTEMSDVFEYAYVITHQPTSGEPYVELNDDTDASYQWYEVERRGPEITDENADTVVYDWGESSYDKETGWTGVAYEENITGQDFFTVALKAGETVIVELTGDFTEGVGLWDYNTNYGVLIEAEEGVSSYEITVGADGDYTFYTFVNSGVVTVKAYTGVTNYIAIEGEASAEIKNPEIGKRYVCEVTYGNGTTEMTDVLKYSYAITHQPTSEEPYVETNDSKAAYQWYTVEDDAEEITDENAKTSTGTYSAEYGWSPMIEASSSTQYYFSFDLKAGDKVTFEFSSVPEIIRFSDFIVRPEETTFSYVADLDRNCELIASYDGTEITVRAYLGDATYTAIEGEISAELKNADIGKMYACEVTFADGKTEMSDTFEVTNLHECDFSGEWKYDADKHWKECTCGETGEEAEHTYTDGKCECGYECPHEWGEGVLTRPTFETDGYYTYTCTLCGHSYTEPTKKANATALNDASMKVMEYIDNNTLTQEARDEIYKSYRDIQKNNGNIFDELGFVRNDLIEEDQPAINAVTEELQKIIDEAEEKIASGEYVKIDGMKEYNKIADALDAELMENYSQEEIAALAEKAGDEINARFGEIIEKAEALTGTVAENKDALAEIESELSALYAEMKNCLDGVHNGLVYEVTEEAKCEVNAIESATCTLCGETDEREVEGSALKHSFTKYEETEAPKCGVAGKEVAYCDHGCQTTDEKEIPALKHSFTKYEVTEEAECGKAGKEVAYCDHGCQTTDEKEIPALKHSFTKYEVTEEAECGKAGKEVAHCDHGCGATDENEIPALKHSFVNYVYNNDATCTADGTKTAKCANGCGATNKIKAEGTKLDHVDGDGDYICDYGCGHIFEQPDTPDDPADDTCHMCGGKVHGNDIMSRISCFFAMIIRFVTEVLNISKK